MFIIKTNSEKTESFTVVNSENLQNAMWAIERIAKSYKYQKHKTEKTPLLFDIYGTCSFIGETVNGDILTFTSEIINYQVYDISEDKITVAQ